MNMKIIVILICTLMIAAALPITTAFTANKKKESDGIETLADYPTAKFSWKAYGFSPFFAFVVTDASDSIDAEKYRWQVDDDSWSVMSSSSKKLFFFPDGQMHKINLEVTNSNGNTGMISHLVFARPLLKSGSGSYSISYITEYDWLDDLSKKYLSAQSTEIQYVFNAAGWSKEFAKTGSSVTESTFKNDVSTSNFHYHCGHGICSIVKTELALKNWLSTVEPSEVKNKWNNKCKWVWLHSCHMLEDCNTPGYDKDHFRNLWAGALNTCHMILGYASVTYPSYSVVSEFFNEALGIGKSFYPKGSDILSSYKIATKFAHGSNVKATVIADTYDQLYDDHLYGQGTVQSDETNNDNTYYTITPWGC